MFDIGWSELLVIAVVLIVVVGPKDLPPMLRAFGKTMTRFRKVAGEFRAQFDEALREADLDEVRQHISDAQRLNPAHSLREAMNPLRQMGNEIKADLQRSTTASSPLVTETPMLTSSAPPMQALESQPAQPLPVVVPPVQVPAVAAEEPLKAARKRRARSIAAVEEPSAAETAQVEDSGKPKRVSRKAAVATTAVDAPAIAKTKASSSRKSAEKKAAAMLVEPEQVGLSEVVEKPRRAPRKKAVSADVAETIAAAPKRTSSPRRPANKKDDA